MGNLSLLMWKDLTVKWKKKKDQKRVFACIEKSGRIHTELIQVIPWGIPEGGERWMGKGEGGRSIDILIMLAFFAFEPYEKQEKQTTKKILLGISLVVQRVRLRAPSAGGLGSIPGWGTRMCAATKKPSCLNYEPTCCNEDPTCHN